MDKNNIGLSDLITGDLPNRWVAGKNRLSNFLRDVGVTGDEHSQSLYIFPVHPLNELIFLEELHAQMDSEERWAYLTSEAGINKRPTVIAFPINKNYLIRPGSPNAIKKSRLALFVEIHSRLISWWLVNAWRSRQLSDATWNLGDSVQIIPAASCARSLLETAASVWVETKELYQLWNKTKFEYSQDDQRLDHWLEFHNKITEMMWGAKFDKKVPDLEKTYGSIRRSNVLTQIEKLARATDNPVQKDYQWLCNAVHPSVGGMLAFAAPMMGHDTGTHAIQWVCSAPTSVRSIYVDREKRKALQKKGAILKDMEIIESATSAYKEVYRESTIQDALARSATFAVEVLEKTLDDALKIIDDIGLTTQAPTMANFEYWRNITRKQGNALCPCRSGKKAKHCLHRWTDPVPVVVSQFILNT